MQSNLEIIGSMGAFTGGPASRRMSGLLGVYMAVATLGFVLRAFAHGG